MNVDLPNLVSEIHRAVLDRVDENASIADTEISQLVRRSCPLLSAEVHRSVVEQVNARLHGLGPLDALLSDPSISEVMVNGAGEVWIERHGTLACSDVIMEPGAVRAVIERIVAPLGLRVDRTSPLVDARLPDGSRVNIVVPPVALDGPCVTVRRFSADGIPLDAFCNRETGAALADAVACRRNIIVSGGTGSGKTTLLNALASFIPSSERVITIEDAAELRLPGDHVVRLESRPANGEGVGEITARMLVRNALRMRPDRIIVGEVRGGEALDMVQAMNTGHAGSLSSCHANSAADALRRIETMMLLADVGLPLDVVREHVFAALDVVVQVERSVDGVRRITDVVTVDSRGELSPLLPVRTDGGEPDGPTRSAGAPPRGSDGVLPDAGSGDGDRRRPGTAGAESSMRRTAVAGSAAALSTPTADLVVPSR